MAVAIGSEFTLDRPRPDAAFDRFSDPGSAQPMWLLAQAELKPTPQQRQAVERIMQELIDGTISPQQADDAIRAATAASASRAGWITKLLPFLKWGGLALGVVVDLLLNAEPAGNAAADRAVGVRNRLRQMSEDPSSVGRLLSELTTMPDRPEIRQGMDRLYSEFFNAMTAAKGGDPQSLDRARNILSAMVQFHLGPPDAATQSTINQIVDRYAERIGVPTAVRSGNAQDATNAGRDGLGTGAAAAFDPNLVGPAIVGPRAEQFSAEELNARLQRFASTFNGATPGSAFFWRQVSDSGRFETVPLDQTHVLSKAQADAAAYNRSGTRVSIAVPVDYWDQASRQHVQGVLHFSGLDPRVVLDQFNNYLVALDRSASFNVRGNLDSILEGSGLSVDGLRNRARQMADADFAKGLPVIGGRQASFGDASRYEAGKQAIRTFNGEQLSRGRRDDISLFVPADNGRYLFMERITGGQAASLLNWAIDGGALRDGTSAQSVIDANGLGSVLGLGRDGRVAVLPRANATAEDDPFTKRVLPNLTPAEQDAWRRFAEAHPDVVTLVREAAHDGTDADRAEAARALMAGAYGQDVVAWLRAGGLGSDRLPPGLPPRGTATATDGADPEPGIDQAARARLDSLFARSTQRSEFDSLPGDRGGPVNDRYLSTRTLTPSDLGYTTGLDTPATNPTPLATTLEGVPRVNVIETAVQLVSDVHNGRAASVRLGQIADGPLAGRVVAIKTYTAGSADAESTILQEVRSAQLLQNLGLMRFHGVFQDAQGRFNVVTDVVAGDFPAAYYNAAGNPISTRTFAQLDTALARLQRAGVSDIGDFQYLVTPQGNLGVIDPGTLASRLGRTTSTDPSSARGLFTAQRAQLLAAAPTEVGNAYLDQLARSNPALYEALMTYINGPVRAQDPAMRPMMESLSGRYGEHQPPTAP